VDMAMVGWAALGAAMGAPTRYIAGHYLDRRAHYGTLAVNIIGSFVLGVLSAHTANPTVLALWGSGFCGGLTTYSSFAVQSVNSGLRRGIFYIVVTIVGCLGAAWLGYVT